MSFRFSNDLRNQIIEVIEEAAAVLYDDDRSDCKIVFNSPFGFDFGERNQCMWTPLGGFRFMSGDDAFKDKLLKMEKDAGFDKQRMRDAAAEVEKLATDLRDKASAWRDALSDAQKLATATVKVTESLPPVIDDDAAKDEVADLGAQADATAARIRSLF